MTICNREEMSRLACATRICAIAPAQCVRHVKKWIQPQLLQWPQQLQHQQTQLHQQAHLRLQRLLRQNPELPMPRQQPHQQQSVPYSWLPDGYGQISRLYKGDPTEKFTHALAL